MVYCPLAKIQFESNSQLILNVRWTGHRCIALWQRYNLKAIHNMEQQRKKGPAGVLPFGKDTIWKQFTTYCPLRCASCMVYCPLAKIQFESNSQRRQRSNITTTWCIALWQRYNLKAIHNCYARHLHLRAGVLPFGKDTIWKQFTTIDVSLLRQGLGVLPFGKDTIWKQFTTVCHFYPWVC